ncbi:hypothetical protein LTR53_006013 [Teratosphaeriaceae sp. CCFEE 6253]|nr:hypothetical protein LTR53_006013 [Teratosphaeriaceae sp. CCFEE 6253]
MEGEKASSTRATARLAEYKQRFWTPELALSDGTKEVLAIHPYPCIGMGRFLNLAIGQHQLYHSEILPRMLSGEQTYLDLGCAFAQDVRRLVADGVDSSKCYGSDLRLDFIELGYELFNDRETLQSRFIAADVFDENSALQELNGHVDIIDASSFFHLFTLAEQKQIARSVIKLIRPRRDSLVVGRQVGNAKPAEFPRRDGQGSRFRHDIDSWREMWDEVGDEAGVKFTVDGRMNTVASLGNKVNTTEAEADSAMMMEFLVRRMG